MRSFGCLQVSKRRCSFQTRFYLCSIHPCKSFVLFFFLQFIQNGINAFETRIHRFRLSASGNRNMLAWTRITSAGPADAQKWAESFTALLSSKRKLTICGLFFYSFYYIVSEYFYRCVSLFFTSEMLPILTILLL